MHKASRGNRGGEVEMEEEKGMVVKKGGGGKNLGRFFMKAVGGPCLGSFG